MGFWWVVTHTSREGRCSRQAARNAVFFPLAGLQLAFDVALRTLAQVLASNLGNLAEQHNTMPLGALLLLALVLSLWLRHVPSLAEPPVEDQGVRAA